jgi:GDPmannose 4,6-dehydratase
MRTNSVMSYLLLSLAEAGYPVSRLETAKGDKVIDEPIEPDKSEIFGISFEKTKVDDMMLRGKLDFRLEDEGVAVHSGSQRIKIAFDPERFTAEVLSFLDTQDRVRIPGQIPERNCRPA